MTVAPPNEVTTEHYDEMRLIPTATGERRVSLHRLLSILELIKECKSHI